MNKLACLFTVALCRLAVPHASAQTDSSKDFARLKDQRDKAVAAAIAPIDQKYHESLKSVLARATREGDFPTVTAITEILNASQAAAAPVKPLGALTATPSPAKGSIWKPSNNDGFFYVLFTNPDNSVGGFMYNTVANKSSNIVGRKAGNTIEARWPTVYGNESWDGKFTERPDGGFDVDRVYADGPSKGRRDLYQLKPLTGDEYKRARKMLDAKVSTPEAKSALRKVPRE